METPEAAVGVPQELGRTEYGARCFVGPSRLSTATAKRLSEVTEVARTRVDDAVRVLVVGNGLVGSLRVRERTRPRRLRPSRSASGTPPACRSRPTRSALPRRSTCSNRAECSSARTSSRGPVGVFLDRLLRRAGFDPGTVTKQVVSAHGVLPHLRHVLLVAARPG